MIAGVEVWVPRGEILVPSSGAYGEHVESARASARSVFRRGEGLPGAVWSTERALIWRELGVHSTGAEQVKAACIDAALGLPVCRDSELCAVVVLLFAARTTSPGCVELWNREGAVLEHGGGHYRECAEFEKLSQLIQFPLGTGLPGGAWAEGGPLVMPDVRKANTFIRAGLAAQNGLGLGVGLPLRRRNDVAHVLTLIAGAERPFIHALELWKPDAARALRLAQCSRLGEMIEPDENAVLGKDLALSVLDSGLPKALSKSDLGVSSGNELPFEIVLGLPTHDRGQVSSVLCLMF